MNSPKNKTPQELWPDSTLVRKSLTTLSLLPCLLRSRNLPLLLGPQPRPISLPLLCLMIQTWTAAILLFLVLATALQAANTVIAVFYN